MSITFRAAGTAKTGTTSLTNVAQPAGTVAGDVLVALIADLATSGTSAAPTGWTNITALAASGTGGRLQVFTAVVGQNGLTGTTWTWSSLTTRALGQIYGYSGASTDYANQPDTGQSKRVNAAGTPAATGTTTITPQFNNDMVIAGYSAYGSSTTNFWSAEAVGTAPTLVEHGDINNSTFISIALASGVLATAAPTGASSATMATTTVTNRGVLFSLKPPQTLPTVTVASASLAPTTAVFQGNITSIGDDATCTERGVVYDTSSHGAPGNVAPASSGYASSVNETGLAVTAGTYTESLSSLTASTTYFYRGYAKNVVGYSYSAESSFTTLAASSSTIDVDAVVTKIVTGFNAGPVTDTWSHTCSGSNRLLVLTATIWQDIAGTGTVTAASYNSLPMTGPLVTATGGVGGQMRTEIWYMLAPPSGAHTMSVTITGALDARKHGSMSFTGCAQVSGAGNTNSAISSNNSPTCSLLTGTAGSLIVGVTERFTTLNYTPGTFGSLWNDHATSTTAAGQYFITTTATTYTDDLFSPGADPLQDWSECLAEFKKFVATGYVTQVGAFMVGP